MSLTTPTVLLGFLLPWTWVHGSSSKAQLLILTLDKGYLLTAAPPDLERGVAPLSPPVPAQLPLLGIAPSLIVFKSKVYITFISITDVLYTSLGLNSSS